MHGYDRTEENLIHKLIVGKNMIVLLEQKEEPTNNVRKVKKLSNCSLYVCSLNYTTNNKA
jgi:hypothetical protein